MQKPNLDDHLAAAKFFADAPMMPCAYCGREMTYSDPKRRPTRDHVWPKRVRCVESGRAGTVWCCHDCNERKADKLPSEWLQSMRDRDAQ